MQCRSHKLYGSLLNRHTAHALDYKWKLTRVSILHRYSRLPDELQRKLELPAGSRHG